jgi:hypothetical protein
VATELVPVPYQDMARMAEAIAKSGLFGMKTADQALALMCVAQAEGRHPASVAVEYHIIQGRPALKSDTMLARFQAAGGKVQWTTYTDARVAAIFSHPNGGSVEIVWTTERAQAAGLTGKDNWNKYPRQMLRARVISEGVRTVFPGVCIGMYTPEEVMDFEPSDPLLADPTRDVGARLPIEHVGTEESENPAPQGKPATAPPQAHSNGGKGVATEKQQKLVRARLDHSGIAEKDFLAAMGIDSISTLPFGNVNSALSWIQQHTP